MPQTISSSKGINITLEDADKLIRSGNGNACLYYLCANFCGQDSVAAISKQLGWTQEKALAAHGSGGYRAMRLFEQRATFERKYAVLHAKRN